MVIGVHAQPLVLCSLTPPLTMGYIYNDTYVDKEDVILIQLVG